MTQLYVLSQDGTSAINLSQFEYVYIGEDNRIKAVNGQKMIRLGDYKSRDSAKFALATMLYYAGKNPGAGWYQMMRGDMDEDTIKAVYGDGIYNDEHDLDTAVLMENAQVNPMKMLMVLLFALTEPVNHRVHDTEWLGGFYKCIKDDESVYRGIYSALDGIGYEISDMEKSLLDGTHPSYEGAEEES